MVEKSGKFFFRDNNPQNPQGKGCKLCPGAYEVFMEGVGVWALEEAQLIGVYNSSSLFKSQMRWTTTSPLPALP